MEESSPLEEHLATLERCDLDALHEMTPGVRKVILLQFLEWLQQGLVCAACEKKVKWYFDNLRDGVKDPGPFDQE